MSLILLKKESHESVVIAERISCSKEFRSETVGALQTLQQLFPNIGRLSSLNRNCMIFVPLVPLSNARSHNRLHAGGGTGNFCNKLGGEML